MMDCSGYRPAKWLLFAQQTITSPRMPKYMLWEGAWQTLPCAQMGRLLLKASISSWLSWKSMLKFRNLPFLPPQKVGKKSGGMLAVEAKGQKKPGPIFGPDHVHQKIAYPNS
jgi:hypothetical protein